MQSKKIIAFVESKQVDGKDWAHHHLNEGFTSLEKRLQRTAGRFCVGDDVSIADCCLVPQVYNAIQ